MPKYRKKPVDIKRTLKEMLVDIAIDTLEGTMRVDYGDYIIKGIQGEFYPCKPDIFLATYEEVMEDGNLD